MSGQRIVTSRDAFGRNGVKELRDQDFWIGSANPTALKDNRCHVVLFYEITADTDVNNDPLFAIWRYLAQTIAGPVIAAVNASERDGIMAAFTDVSNDPDNPLYDFSGFSLPQIIVYRNRWPQAYYNGSFDYDSLKKWILVLACRTGYRNRTPLYYDVNAIDAGAVASNIEQGQEEEGYSSGEEAGGEEEGQMSSDGENQGEEEATSPRNSRDVGFIQ
jgi:hypothetical protein